GAGGGVCRGGGGGGGLGPRPRVEVGDHLPAYPAERLQVVEGLAVGGEEGGVDDLAGVQVLVGAACDPAAADAVAVVVEDGLAVGGPAGEPGGGGQALGRAVERGAGGDEHVLRVVTRLAQRLPPAGGRGDDDVPGRRCLLLGRARALRLRRAGGERDTPGAV